jgi:hypothetical protein
VARWTGVHGSKRHGRAGIPPGDHKEELSTTKPEEYLGLRWADSHVLPDMQKAATDKLENMLFRLAGTL